jgi:hypothetical protein
MTDRKMIDGILGKLDTAEDRGERAATQRALSRLSDLDVAEAMIVVLAEASDKPSSVLVAALSRMVGDVRGAERIRIKEES